MTQCLGVAEPILVALYRIWNQRDESGEGIGPFVPLIGRCDINDTHKLLNGRIVNDDTCARGRARRFTGRSIHTCNSWVLNAHKVRRMSWMFGEIVFDRNVTGRTCVEGDWLETYKQLYSSRDCKHSQETVAIL